MVNNSTCSIFTLKNHRYTGIGITTQLITQAMYTWERRAEFIYSQ